MLYLYSDKSERYKGFTKNHPTYAELLTIWKDIDNVTDHISSGEKLLINDKQILEELKLCIESKIVKLFDKRFFEKGYFANCSIYNFRSLKIILNLNNSIDNLLNSYFTILEILNICIEQEANFIIEYEDYLKNNPKLFELVLKESSQLNDSNSEKIL